MTSVGVSLGLWGDRPAGEALTTATAADDLGYPELWIGEMATYDAFALATSIGLRTRRIALTVGPLPVAVRDPMMIAMGAASVADLTGRPVGVAVGTSSPVVVQDWHGRPRVRGDLALRESVQALRPLLAGEKAAVDGRILRTRGYRLRLAAPRSPITVAAFGPSAVAVAAELADRMVLNLVTPDSAARLVALMRDRTPPGRTAPKVAVWVSAAVDPDAEAVERVRRAVVGYLAAPGYAEAFAEAGFADVVAYARGRPHPRELLAAIPTALVESVALLGDAERIRRRIAEYAAAGVDEIALLPVCTDADPGGAGTLRALAGPVERKPAGPRQGVECRS
ncbi:LLM class F420-dependent oxidoreductase [Rhizohabitans arisaemae]|uniref:LLM class F420-dependent oxidoreductase n=1 Tax=Rhizohabitans arisaemae TaxID=2720610 RepID=UPI0024B0FA07|nr:LLM class F420-dependent oxidoreductase [Rhizohabitans arisaemae]